MGSILDAIWLFSTIAHVVLLVFLQFNRVPTRLRSTWLSLAVLWSLLATLLPRMTAALPLPVWAGTGSLLGIALAFSFIAYGQYVLTDVLRHRTLLWLLVGLIWPVVLIAVVFTAENPLINRPSWLFSVLTAPDLSSLVLIGGLAVAAIALVSTAFYSFYAAALPEVANRALYWVLNTAVLAVGIMLVVSGTTTFQVIGVLVVLAGLVSAAYAHSAYRVLDIRGGVVAAIRTVLLIAFAASVIFLALFAAQNVVPETSAERGLVLVVLAILAATVYVLFSHMAGFLFRPFLRQRISPTRAAREYSQQIIKAVELNELIKMASEALNRVLAVRRSGMILVNDTGRSQDAVDVIAMQDGPNAVDLKGTISKTGPIYDRLAVQKLPLAHFDIAYGPLFQSVAPEERRFFDSLQMSAYAPIVIENVLIGILMCGPKLSDRPFSAADLELLATMADQTGIALRNSRAMADLKHLNATMKALNDDLEEANQQYEKLDSVKTDFITIASHELRTPLAQIRGYTDILDALNEQGMLDQDQISGMVTNLRKAAERTEELLSAMLDVSQLDVDAMDLRFAQAAPESILRMAIEPLTEHIKQRKLTLSARGLRGLPAIHCDMQRLVQAFRNIITNAIKFTPDGGRIDITASLQSSDNGRDDHILVAISDTGVGIDKENLELIFEKFYRTYDPSLHSTGAYKFMGAGPGLGLTIARGVIESHGGKVWAESSGHNMETCPGSTFYVQLPVNPPEDARRVAIEDSQAFKNPTPLRRPVT